MEEWQLATVNDVREIVHRDLAACDAEQTATFEKYSVEPYVAPIIRHERMEGVVVVARKGNDVIYWEDIEEGFNVSPIDREGKILEHWCNQDELAFALNAWIENRGLSGRVGPAT